MKSLFRTNLTDVLTDDRDGVGRIRFEDDKVYRWVKNSESTVSLALGAVAFHKFADGMDAYKNIYQAATANLGDMAGITCAVIPAGSYGWVQIVGPNSDALVFASATTAKTAGDFLLGVNAQQYADADVTMGTAPKHKRNLQLLEAVATITTGAAVAHKVYINCFS